MKTHHRRHFAGVVVLCVCASVGTMATPIRIQANVSGTWDVEFSGTVQGAGTSQTDEFVIEVQQDGENVTGTLRVRGLDSIFVLSGKVDQTRFTYTVSGSLGPGCDVRVEAETTVDAATGRMHGTQSQSTCEGTAVGSVSAVRR